MNTRIIVATNKNLKKKVSKQQRFREDLFYRINVVNIHLTLRERREDLPLLTDYFLQNYRKKIKKKIRHITPDAFEILNAGPLAGECEGTGKRLRACICLVQWRYHSSRQFAGMNNMDLKETDPGNQQDSESIKDAEKIHILSVLKKYHGDRKKVSEVLGIHKSTPLAENEEHYVL